MTRRRFYVPRDLIRDGVAILPPTQSHHLTDVLRMRSGDTVEIFDGIGAGYEGRVEVRGSEVSIRDLARVPCPQSPFHVTLAAALIKPAKFEWILEKSTELGIDEIIPLKTRLSDIRIPADRIENRLQRWRRILEEATRQSHRFASPVLRMPLDFRDLLAEEEFSTVTKILFYEKAADPLTSGCLLSDRVILCVGPEGGWDPGEIDQAKGAGYHICGLGPWILRAETAAIAAVSIVQHHLRLLGSH